MIKTQGICNTQASDQFTVKGEHFKLKLNQPFHKNTAQALYAVLVMHNTGYSDNQLAQYLVFITLFIHL